MSFLLDALGKADHDRRRSEVPELRTYRQTGRSPVRAVLRGIALLSLLLLFFVLGYYFRPLLDKNIFGYDETGESLAPSQAANKPVAPIASNPPAPVAKAASAPPGTTPRIYELEVISYSDSPTARFVMINGAMLHEGEVLGSGEVLLTIERDAVVLDNAGKQIRVGM